MLKWTLRLGIPMAWSRRSWSAILGAAILVLLVSQFILAPVGPLVLQLAFGGLVLFSVVMMAGVYKLFPPAADRP